MWVQDLEPPDEAAAAEQAAAGGGWISWLWSGGDKDASQGAAGGLTESDRKELYDAINYDPDNSVEVVAHAMAVGERQVVNVCVCGVHGRWRTRSRMS